MSWPLVRLSNVCEINIGKTPARANPDYWGIGKPWLSIADMKQGLKLEKTKEQITELAIKETNIKLVLKGTVLFSFKLSIGKIGIAERNLYTNEAIAALPIKDQKLLCEEYLVYALTQMDALRTTDRAVMGATLNKAKLANLKIPLPPLEEQKRIAAILDKADALRRKREKAIQLTDTLLRSVFLDMFGDPVTNPKGWEVQKLKNIVDGKYGIKAGPFGSALKKEEYTSSGYRIYGQEQVIGGSLDIGDYYIDEKKFNSLKSCAVKSGDVLISLVGSFGKVLIVPEQFDAGIINPRLVKVSLDKGYMNPNFLEKLLASKPLQNHLKNSAHGGTMGILNAGKLKELNCILPPTELQEVFSEKISKIEKLIDKLHSTFSETNALISSLTQRAFRGKLTSKDLDTIEAAE